jgi:3,5-epimerase/4-reductase
MSFLVLGAEGWIGAKIVALLYQQNEIVHASKVRIEHRSDIEQEIEKFKPSFIFNCAGKTGRPNVDWCESNQQETIRSNVLGAANVADVAFQRGIHVSYFGTGCIYEYDQLHPINGMRICIRRLCAVQR